MTDKEALEILDTMDVAMFSENVKEALGKAKKALKDNVTRCEALQITCSLEDWDCAIEHGHISLVKKDFNAINTKPTIHFWG